MRVNHNLLTSTFLKNLNRTFDRLDRLNKQLSAGKMLINPNIDPSSASLALNFRNVLGKNTQYKDNIDSAYNWLSYTDTSLTEIDEIMVQIKELALNGANEHHSETSRAALAEEINEKLEQVRKLANYNYAGRYIFGGYETQKEPFEAGNNNIQNIDKLPIQIKNLNTAERFADLPELEDGDYYINLNSDGENIFMQLTDERGRIIQIDGDGINKSGISSNTMSNSVIIGNASEKVFDTGRGFAIEFSDFIEKTANPISFKVRYEAGNNYVYQGDSEIINYEISNYEKVQTNITGDRVFGGETKEIKFTANLKNKNGGPVTKGTFLSDIADTTFNVKDKISITGYTHDGKLVSPFARVTSNDINLAQKNKSYEDRTLNIVYNDTFTEASASLQNVPQAKNLGVLEVINGVTDTPVGSSTIQTMEITEVKRYQINESTGSFTGGETNASAMSGSTAFSVNNPAAGDTISWTGVDSSGNEITGTYAFSSNPSSDTYQDLFTEIENSFGGDVQISINNNKIEIQSSQIGSTGSFTISDLNYNGVSVVDESLFEVSNTSQKGTDWKANLSGGPDVYFNSKDEIDLTNNSGDEVTVLTGNNIQEGKTFIKFSGSYQITVEAKDYNNIFELRDEINSKLSQTALRGAVNAVIEGNEIVFASTLAGSDVSLAVISNDTSTLGFSESTGTSTGFDAFNVERKSTLNDFTSYVEDIFGNSIETDFDSNGALIIKDKRQGESKLALNINEGIDIPSNWNNTNSKSIVNISGTYAGNSNSTWSIIVDESGEVGESDSLQVSIYDDTGHVIRRLDLGEDYIPGKKIPIKDGVEISFSSGNLIEKSRSTVKLTNENIDFGTSYILKEGGNIDVFQEIKNTENALRFNILENKCELDKGWTSSSATPVVSGEFSGEYNDLWRIQVETVQGNFGETQAFVPDDFDFSTQTESERTLIFNYKNNLPEAITIDAKDYENIDNLIAEFREKITENSVLADNIKPEKNGNNIIFYSDKLTVEAVEKNNLFGIDSIGLSTGRAVLNVKNSNDITISKINVDTVNKDYHIKDGAKIAFYKGSFDLNDIFTMKVGKGINNQIDVMDKAQQQLHVQQNTAGVIQRRLEQSKTRIENLDVVNNENLSQKEGSTTDAMAEAMTNLAREETAYQQILAANARMMLPTLMDFLR